MWSVVSPILVRVTGFTELTVLTVCEEKSRAPGDTLAAGPVPGPESETPGAVPEMLLSRTTLPMRLPRAAGLKVTLTMQTFPGSSELLQLLVWLKSPVTEIPVIETAALPLLVKVTLLVALDVPTS